jgi:hypothetical protein
MQAAIRRTADDVGERAAPVDPKFPIATRSHEIIHFYTTDSISMPRAPIIGNWLMWSMPVESKLRDPGPVLAPLTPSLTAAMRRARIEAAEHSEIVSDLRGGEIARLEALAEAIKPLLDQVPASVDMFDTGLVPGDRPRLFIDMIAFVEIDRDRRTYHFVQDTRHGRVSIARSERVDVIAEKIADYIGRRLVERERALAADQTIEDAAQRLVARTGPKAEPPPAANDVRKPAQQAVNAVAPAAPESASRAAPAADALPPRRRSLFLSALMFIVELIGSIVLFATLAIVGWFGWNAFWQWWSVYNGG